MSAQKFSQYQAYSLATRTVPKTKQIVMLYDGAIRFLKQAKTAIAEKRIEDRFRLLSRASEVMAGLQNSIDYDNGGEVAMTLHKFYTNVCVRILSVNFNPKESENTCESIIEELKQMRDVWDTIDRTLNTSGGTASASAAAATVAAAPVNTSSASGNVTFSA